MLGKEFSPIGEQRIRKYKIGFWGTIWYRTKAVFLSRLGWRWGRPWICGGFAIA